MFPGPVTGRREKEKIGGNERLEGDRPEKSLPASPATPRAMV